MLTDNAKRIFIFYDNVTCFGTNKSCSKKGHLPECFIKALHLLLARVKISTCCSISFSSYTLQLPSCPLPTDFQKLAANNWGLLTLVRWDFSNTSREISALGRGSTSLDVNKTNGMLTGNAKRIFIFYDNVTCFGTNKSCSKKGHLPECFIKALHFLLAKVKISTCFSISLSPHTPCSFPPVSCRLLSRNYVRTIGDFSL